MHQFLPQQAGVIGRRNSDAPFLTSVMETRSVKSKAVSFLTLQSLASAWRRDKNDWYADRGQKSGFYIPNHDFSKP